MDVFVRHYSPSEKSEYLRIAISDEINSCSTAGFELRTSTVTDIVYVTLQAIAAMLRPPPPAHFLVCETYLWTFVGIPYTGDRLTAVSTSTGQHKHTHLHTHEYKLIHVPSGISNPLSHCSSCKWQ